MTRSVAITSVVFFAASTALAAVPDGPDAPVDFSREVRPILSDICFKCHGPDRKARKADLRLDIREEAEHVLEPDLTSGAVELLWRIKNKNPKKRMPPVKSKLSLTEAQIDVLGRWIKQGAPYKQHWAFETVRKPEVPKVKRSNWARNDIDRFILAQLETRGLSDSRPGLG